MDFQDKSIFCRRKLIFIWKKCDANAINPQRICDKSWKLPQIDVVLDTLSS